MTTVSRVLRNQVRGMTGAFIVAGVTILLTIEAWWLAWERPASHLIAYAVVGLGVVLLIARSSGFRVEEEDDEDESQYDPVRLVADFAQLVLQSVLAAFVVLFVYGIVTLATPLHVVARVGLIEVVPLGFGAALANRLLRETEEQPEDSAEEQSLRLNLAIFAVGAIFFALPLAPSIEMDVLATNAGWSRLTALVVLSLLTTYLILYELEFRGQSGRRTEERRLVDTLLHVGQTCIVYAVGVAVSALLLWGFDSLKLSLAYDLQKIVVLSFPTTVGGAAARVIL